MNTFSELEHTLKQLKQVAIAEDELKYLYRQIVELTQQVEQLKRKCEYDATLRKRLAHTSTNL